LSQPYIPDASAAMLEAVAADETGWPEDVGAALVALPGGHAIKVPDVLFRKITDEERDAWQARFAGGRG
jgi:methionyl-tRNA synthetase